ncbi:hypothetical protein NIA73_20090 [Anaerobutyricum hallii]|nr:hypothetical protein [Anaerobutyricum hallii]
MKKVEILWKKKSIGNHPMNMKKDREARVWECLQKKKKWINASQLKETKIEKIEDGLLDRAVNEKDRYIFEKEYMNPKKEKILP